jgi:hypothetical protein
VGVAVGVVGVGVGVVGVVGVGVGVVGVGVGVTSEWFAMLAEQMTRAPPPLAEPLHWLIVTRWAADFVPVAVQVSPTRVPPLAEPLHWVIAAPLVVAG